MNFLMRALRWSVLVLIIILCACKGSSPEYQGYVEGENVYMATPYSGNVVDLLIKRGQPVKKGEVLVRLDANPQQFLLAEAEASLQQGEKTLLDLKMPRRAPEIAAIEAQIKQADAQIELASLRVKRNQTLYAKHVLDLDTLDQSLEHYQEVVQLKAQYQANLDLAKDGARVEQINAQQKQVAALIAKRNQAKWDAEQKTIYAPFDAVVFDVYFKKGEYVGAQKPILSLLAPSNIRLDFFIPLDVVSKVQLGQRITFTRAGSKQIEEADISYISPEAEYEPPLIYSRENDSQLVFRVKAIARNPKAVKPGEPVLVSLDERRHVS